MDELLKQELLFSGLKEISNIGTGNAINELSKQLELPVDQLVPESRIIFFEELHEVAKDPMAEYYCAIADIDGDIDGMILVLFTTEAFTNLISVFKETKQYLDYIAEHGEKNDIECYEVIADIITQTYLKSLSTFLNVDLNRYEINIIQETLISILSIPAMKFIGVDENLSITHSTFTFDMESGNRVGGHIVYIPGSTAIKNVMAKLLVN